MLVYEGGMDWSIVTKEHIEKAIQEYSARKSGYAIYQIGDKKLYYDLYFDLDNAVTYYCLVYAFSCPCSQIEDNPFA